MTKGTNTTFICQNCGYQSRKWLGKCPECGEWNSLVEERVVTTRKGAGRNGFRLREAKAVEYNQIESQDDVRLSSGVNEFDRVLGGGIVPGTLVLIGGDPGIGKSTLLLQVADKLSSSGATVLYVSGEESERQIKLRGDGLASRRPTFFCSLKPIWKISFARSNGCGPARSSWIPFKPRFLLRLNPRPVQSRKSARWRRSSLCWRRPVPFRSF
jgi:predicted ATP-dependent serine protease